MDKKSKGIIFILLLLVGLGAATYALENTDIKERFTESSAKANGTIEMKVPQEGESTTANKGTTQVDSGAGEVTNAAKDNAAQEAGVGEKLEGDPDKAKAQEQNQKVPPKKDGKEKAKGNHKEEAKGQKAPKKKPLRKGTKIVRKGWPSYFMGCLGQVFMAYLLIAIAYITQGVIFRADSSHTAGYTHVLIVRFFLCDPHHKSSKNQIYTHTYFSFDKVAYEVINEKRGHRQWHLLYACIVMLVIDFGMYLFNRDGVSLSALLAKIPFIGYPFGGFWYNMMYTEEVFKKDLKPKKEMVKKSIGLPKGLNQVFGGIQKKDNAMKGNDKKSLMMKGISSLKRQALLMKSMVFPNKCSWYFLNATQNRRISCFLCTWDSFFYRKGLSISHKGRF